MPLVRITTLNGKSDAHLAAVVAGIHDALVHTWGMPEEDLFTIVDQKGKNEFLFDRHWATRSPRTDDFMVIHIETGNGGPEAKEALYERIAANLSSSPGVSPQDVLVTLILRPYLEDWSFGNGISAAKGF